MRTGIALTVVALFAAVAYFGPASSVAEISSDLRRGANPPASPAPASPAPGNAVEPTFAPKQPVFWATANPEADERIARTLHASLDDDGLEFTESVLAEVAEFVRDRYQLPVRLNVPALTDLAISPDEPITCSIHWVSLAAGLRLMLEDVGLTYVIKDEVLEITTEEQAETELVAAVYPVSDFVEREAMPQLMNSLVTAVAAHTWAGNGGGEGEICQLGGGILLVKQTRHAHDEIRRTLQALRAACNASQRKITTTTAATPADYGGFGEGR